MSDRPNSVSEGTKDVLERDRIRYQWMLDSLFKFRLFFTALVFTILSFSIQFQVNTNDRLIIAFEIGAWILLGITGYFSLKDCGGFSSKITEQSFEGLSQKQRKAMWACFFGGLVLLMVAKSVDSYLAKVEMQPNKAAQAGPPPASAVP